MSTDQFAEITKKLDKHFEKSGVVLVGMHQELQAQKQRISQYHDKVDSVTSDLNRRRDEIVGELRAQAEAAISVLDQTTDLVDRLKTLATEAEGAISHAQQNIKQSHSGLIEEANQLAARLESGSASFKHEMRSVLDQSSADQAAIFDALKVEREIFQASLENRLAKLFVAIDKQLLDLEKHANHVHKEAIQSFSSATSHAQNGYKSALTDLAAEHSRLLGQTGTNFQDAVNKQEERINQHLDAHKRFLKSSYEELAERQRASDFAFKELKAEAELHQTKQDKFAKKTRYILSGLLTSGLVLFAIFFVNRVSML